MEEAETPMAQCTRVEATVAKAFSGPAEVQQRGSSGKRAKGVGALDEGWNARRWTGGGGGGVVGIVRWAAAWGRT